MAGADTRVCASLDSPTAPAKRYAFTGKGGRARQAGVLQTDGRHLTSLNIGGRLAPPDRLQGGMIDGV